jgi:hypothetical protein
LACEKGFKDIVLILLKSRSDPNAKDNLVRHPIKNMHHWNSSFCFHSSDRLHSMWHAWKDTKRLQ